MTRAAMTFLLSIVCSVSTAQIDVYTITSIAITGKDYADNICVLDIEEHLAGLLLNALKRHEDIQTSIEAKSLDNSILCQAKAARLNILKLPAIVLDDKYVVYGEPNILSARDVLWRAHG